MANPIDILLAKVENFNKNLTDGTYIKEIVQRYEAEIVDINSQEQLYDKGIDSLGRSIASYMPYSPATIKIKQIKNQPYDRVTLRDEGDFYRGFFIKFIDDGFIIESNDWKEGLLTFYYGWEIFGLTPENKAFVSHEYIYTDLLKIARNVL